MARTRKIKRKEKDTMIIKDVFRNMDARVIDDLTKITGDDCKNLKKALSNAYAFYGEYARFCNLVTRSPIVPDNLAPQDLAMYACVIQRINILLDYVNKSSSYQVAGYMRTALEKVDIPDELAADLNHVRDYPEFDGNLLRTMLRPIAEVDPRTRRVKYQKTELARQFYKSAGEYEDLVRLSVKKAVQATLELTPYGVCSTYGIECANLLLKPEYEDVPDFREVVEQLRWCMWTMQPRNHGILPETAQAILMRIPDEDDRDRLGRIFYHADLT